MTRQSPCLSLKQGAWVNYKGVLWLCDIGLLDYFDIPRSTKKIRVILSDREVSESYQVKWVGSISIEIAVRDGEDCRIIWDPVRLFIYKAFKAWSTCWIGIEYV